MPVSNIVKEHSFHPYGGNSMAMEKRDTVFAELLGIARSSNNQISYKEIMASIE